MASLKLRLPSYAEFRVAVIVLIKGVSIMRISFVGGGMMAEAMIGGILKAKLATQKESVVGEPSAERRAYLTGKYGIEARADNVGTVKGAELVVLSIKPQQLGDVMAEMKPNLSKEQVVLSIIAGARMETLTNGLQHQAVVRVMPNTPSQIGAGMSVWLATSQVPPVRLEICRSILTTLGEEVHVADEKFIDMATALSASGPAYVYLFIEAMIDAGVYMGMQRDMARKLVLQTVMGTTRMVKESGRHPAELRDMVTSPGGTTAEALKVFEQSGFRGTILEAVVAAYQKSKALGGQR